VASGIDYYERRAGEHDATSWKRVDADGRVAKVVRSALDSLAPMNTLDVGCGTGYVNGWLPGRITLLDSSPAMHAIASRRVDGAAVNLRPWPCARRRGHRAQCRLA
jgi:ubiquinone/menaquinone biosynthesis C-methylase UbiE